MSVIRRHSFLILFASFFFIHFLCPCQFPEVGEKLPNFGSLKLHLLNTQVFGEKVIFLLFDKQPQLLSVMVAVSFTFEISISIILVTYHGNLIGFVGIDRMIGSYVSGADSWWK